MAGRWPFVGRSREFARAEQVLAEGVGLLVTGEPGVGKTAFARELVRRATASGAGVTSITGHVVSSGTPFEVFAGVLPTQPASTLGVSEVAALVSAALRPGAVLVVDDVHLLDEPSAQVLLRLATTGAAITIATARESPLPSAVDRLWRDGFCERTELRPLADEDVHEVLETVLAGTVDSRAVREFAVRAQGNPLLLRELVNTALDQGALTRGELAWTLTGAPPLSRGVRELVAERLAGTPDVHRGALEVIAAGEPVPVDVAVELMWDAVLDELEARRLIIVQDGLAGPEVSSAHPLYGEVLRAGMPALRVRRLRLALAGHLEARPNPSALDLVRAALWRMESGQVDEPERLLAAARAARGLSLETAERLARHAHQMTGSLAATLLLAEILTHTGRRAEAGELTAVLPPDSLSADEREAITYCAAMGQGLMAGDPGGGADLVAGLLAGVPAASSQLRALHAALLAFDARFADALEIGRPIADDPAVDPAARTLAAIGTVGAEYWLGRAQAAVAIADRIAPIAATTREALPFGAASIELIAICALAERGDLDAAEQRARRMQDQAVAGADAFAGPRADYCLGRIALLRGRAETALRHFRRSLASRSPFDEFIVRHLSAMVARAAATCGDVDSAQAALAAVVDATRMKTYEPECDLADAAALAASLRMDEAVERAAWAAGVAADQNQWNIASAAYHDAARYGGARQVLIPMREAVAHVDGTLAWCYLDHATALAADDAITLDEVARRFEAHGALLFAAEATAAAAHAHARAGQARPARASGARARVLRERCEGAVSPWLAGATEAVPLTARERQVAALAADGLGDAEIAARLAISVRTVQTHLGRVYDKLGVNRRGELATRLT